MKLKFTKSQSSVKPELVDTTSSKKVVYIHQNIVEVQKDDTTFYDYDEAKLTKDEYKEYLAELETQDTFEIISEFPEKKFRIERKSHRFKTTFLLHQFQFLKKLLMSPVKTIKLSKRYN